MIVAFPSLKALSHGLKSLAKLFKLVVCNPCQSSPSLTILVPLWFIVISLMFFYLYKALFLSFLQFNSNFVDAQNNSKYRDGAPLNFSLFCYFFQKVKNCDRPARLLCILCLFRDWIERVYLRAIYLFCTR